MNRPLAYLLGPEAAMILLTALVFLFCARHYSYSSRDVAILNRFLWLIPLLAVALAYATAFVPGAKSWWWLGRVNVSVFVAITVCANKVVDGLVAPGAGPGTGATAIFAVLCFGLVLAALANAFGGAYILAEHKPAFAQWYHAHRFLGYFLTLLAAIPIGAVMLAAGTLVVGIYSSFVTLSKN